MIRTVPPSIMATARAGASPLMKYPEASSRTNGHHLCQSKQNLFEWECRHMNGFLRHRHLPSARHLIARSTPDSHRTSGSGAIRRQMAIGSEKWQRWQSTTDHHMFGRGGLHVFVSTKTPEHGAAVASCHNIACLRQCVEHRGRPSCRR